MVARNDITGDKIQSRDLFSDEAEVNFENIFGKKKKTNGGWTPPPLEFNEDRIDVIGQNGNDGEHYDITKEDIAKWHGVTMENPNPTTD